MLQSLGDLLDLAMGIGAFCPLDVDGSVLVREPANQCGPLDFGLGYESSPGEPAENQNIEPAGVIGDDEAVWFQRRSLEPRPDAGNVCRGREKARRPGRAANQKFR